MGVFCLRFAATFFILVSFFNNQVFPEIFWGSQNSKIKVSSGARLNVGTSSLVVGGTLSQDSGAAISGSSFSFENGILEQDDVEIFAKGNYDPSSTNVLNLVGNSLFRFEPGSVVYGIAASGVGNVISGQPLLQNPIVLANGSTEVSIGIQNALSKDIELNGGKIICIDDLNLADEVKIVGPGSIDLNDRQLTLGGYYSTPWAQALTFYGATSVYLTGNTQLSGAWTFSGICRINGNGEILDLSSGGQIILLSGAKLYIEDIDIKGLGDLAGKIVFTDGTSELHLTNARFGLSGNYTTAVGKIFVEGCSTFILRNFNWTITSPANLTVNSDVLWLEVLSREVYPDSGELRASRPIYDGNGYNSANVAANISDGTLTLLNDGTIKETTSESGSTPDPIIVSGNVDVDVTLNQTIILKTNQIINITGDNITIDGGGQSVVFTYSTNPQFVVQPGDSVVLQNITLAHIYNNTFDIKEGAQIIIGENVTFTFAEDGSFSGPFVVADGVIFTLIGEGSQKVVAFINDSPTIPSLDLGNGTLKLENIELNGLSDIRYGSSCLINLAGEAEVDIDIDNGINFQATGPENEFTFLEDDLTLSGLISFGGQSVNELIIRFVPVNGLRAGAIHPIINFSGGPGIMLGGDATQVSRLEIENPYVMFGLLDNNSFLLDAGGQLFFNELELVPAESAIIKQYSSNVLINGTRLLGQIDSSFVRAYFASEKQKPVTGYSTSAKSEKREKKRMEPKPEADKVTLNKVNPKTEEKNNSNQSKVKEKHKNTSEQSRANGKDSKNKFRDEKQHKSNRKAAPHLKTVEGFEEFLNDGVDDVSDDFTTLRSVQLPASYDLVYEDMKVKQTNPPVGNILVSTESHMFNVTTEKNGFYPTTDIVLRNDSMLSFADQNVILNPENQKINVVGTGNVIEVSGSLHINNNLLLDDGAELTIKFKKTGSETPYVVFEEDSTIDVEYSGVLRFEGPGIVKLGDGVIVNLNGEKITSSRTGEIVSIQRAQLIIHDGAILTLEPDAQAKVSGVGLISVQDRGYINLTSAGTLFIGDDQTDDIDLEVIGSSEIELSSSSGVAKVSMEYVTSNVKFENGGVLTIGQNGVFEMNCNDTSLRRGNIKSISFDGKGGLFVKENGILKLAPNRVDPSTGYGFKLEWIGSEMSLNGQGYVQYSDYKSSGNFVGKINPLNSKIYADYYNGTTLNFEQIASMLVNQNSNLTASTLYQDASGNQFVRTKSGINVQLVSGDVIDSDNASSGKIFGHDAQGKPFVILANGTRQ